MITAFIPARGGSEGVPGKNIRILHNKPLIVHSLEFAVNQKEFEKVVVSTDSEEIAIAAFGSEVVSKSLWNSLGDDQVMEIASERIFLHKRPKQEAMRLSPIRDTIFKFASRRDNLANFEFICMLQPTSPFRRHQELTEITQIAMERDEWTSIVSVADVGGNHPDRMWRLFQDGLLSPLIDQEDEDNRPRQLLEKLYIKDGAYYFLKKEQLLRQKLLGNRVIPYIRKGLCTVNIDSELDFILASAITSPYTQNT
jgi:CMP-N,N'-diacetyllegionaminic acid synthase